MRHGASHTVHAELWQPVWKHRELFQLSSKQVISGLVVVFLALCNNVLKGVPSRTEVTDQTLGFVLRRRTRCRILKPLRDYLFLTAWVSLDDMSEIYLLFHWKFVTAQSTSPLTLSQQIEMMANSAKYYTQIMINIQKTVQLYCSVSDMNAA